MAIVDAEVAEPVRAEAMTNVSTQGEPQQAKPAGTAGQDPEQKRAILDRAINHLRRMRYFRRQYDQQRALYYRQYLGKRDARNFPDNVTPRSNTFVNYSYSNVETIVSRVHDAFFSIPEWFEIDAKTKQDEGPSESMELVLRWMLHRSNFIQVFEDYVRNVLIYGHAGLKVDWDWGYDIVNYIDQEPITDPQTQQPVFDPMTGQPMTRPVRKTNKVPRNRPKFTAIDVYDLLVDPDRAILAHLAERTWGQIQQEFEMNPEIYDPDGITKLKDKLSVHKNPDEIIVRLAEIWNENDNSWTIVTFGEDSEALSWKDLRSSYRQVAYSPYRRRLYAGEPILLYFNSNPFDHKRAPILHTSFSKLPNEVFGLGAVEIISDLNESLNRMVNMITDNWNLGVNKRYAYDINAEIDHEALNNFNVPGGKVGVSGDPSKVVMPLPTFEPQRGDYMILELYQKMIELTSGISDFYGKGIGGPQGNRTSTGISQAIGEMNYKFRMFIRNLELDILQPMLEMCAGMVQQYVTDEFEMMLTDAPPQIPKFKQVRPEELVGNFSYNIVAANYATSKMVRQRNAMALANILGQSPFINQYEAIRELLKVFDVRNLNRLLKTQEQVQQEQQEAQEMQIQMMLFQHALEVDTKTKQAQARGKGGKGGRPATSQFEGQIPGTTTEGLNREIAQNMGDNVMGMPGMGSGGGY